VQRPLPRPSFSGLVEQRRQRGRQPRRAFPVDQAGDVAAADEDEVVAVGKPVGESPERLAHRPLHLVAIDRTADLAADRDAETDLVAGVVYALAMPFVALTTAYVYFDARVRAELEPDPGVAELPAEIDFASP